MIMKTKLALAMMVAGIASQASALELGEINGTTFSVGGYVKAEGVFTDPDNGDSSFEGSARQTRINFAANREVDGHKLRAFVEGDFWDNNTEADSSYAWRLRHAYVQMDGLTLGQTWNGQFFANAPFDVEMINFFGTGVGTIAGSGAVIRPDLVMHYTHGGLRFTLQDPVYRDADIPDMVVAYTHRTDNGHAFNVALTGREVETLNNDSEFGAAISVAGKLKFGNTALALSAYTGEGNNIYSGWGYGGASNPANQPFSEGEINASGDLVKTTGFTVGVSHRFNDKLRGNIRYGQVTADEVAANVADDTFKMTNVNLIYTYLPGLEFGIEWRDQNAANRPPSSAGSSLRPAGQQLELMAMYKF